MDLSQLLRIVEVICSSDRAIARKIYSTVYRHVLEDKNIRHYLPGVHYSREDAVVTSRLLSICLSAVGDAFGRLISGGNPKLHDFQFLNVYPGEHYRLLSSLSKVINAKSVVEIGTFTGLSAHSFVEGNPKIQVTSFDVTPWNKAADGTHLTPEVLLNGSFRQIVVDLAQPGEFDQHKTIFDSYDIIFMDGPKDGSFEYKLGKLLCSLGRSDFRLLILDDINLIEMVDFWRSIVSPKIDLTSFGHWSGTGVVDVSDGLLLSLPLESGSLAEV